MANNTLIGALRAEATLESGKFVDGARKIRQESIKTENQVKKSFSGMGAAIKGFGGTLAAGLSFGVLAAGAKKALDYAAAIGTVAKQLGVTTKELQIFRYAGQQVGVSTAETDKALQQFNVNLGKAAQGSLPLQKAFAAVGVTIEDIKTKSKTEIFGQIADQMLKQGGAARNAAAGNVIFGEGMSKIIPLLDQGSAGMARLGKAAETLGVVLDDKLIQNAAEAKVKVEALQTVLAAQISGIVAANAASITSLANSLAQLTGAILQFFGSNPQGALAIIGALAGSRFGLPGAAAGGIAGLFAGGRVAKNARDSSNDLGTRSSELRKARQRYLDSKKLYGGGPAGAQDRAKAAAELKRQTALTQSAIAAAKRKPAPIPMLPDLPQFLAPALKKTGGSSRKSASPRDDSEARNKEFLRQKYEMEREELDGKRQLIDAQLSLTHDYRERAELAREALQIEHDLKAKEIEFNLAMIQADSTISAQQKEEAKLRAQKEHSLNNQVTALKLQAINEDEIREQQEQAMRDADLRYSIERDLLGAQRALAETASERRKIELEILNLAYRERKERLERIIRDSKDADERRRAQTELNSLPAQFSAEREGVMQGTRGPWEEFADASTDAAKLEEAFQSVAVNGVGALTDGLMAAINGTKSLGQVFHEVALGIIQDLLRIMIQKMIVQAIGSVVGGIGAGAGAGASMGSIGAAGGVGDLGFLYGFASGGFTGMGNRNKIAGMVHAREFVLSAQATKRLGVPNLAALNNGAPLSAVSNDNHRSMSPKYGDFNFNNYAVMDERQARQTARQGAAAYKREMANSSREGF